LEKKTASFTGVYGILLETAAKQFFKLNTLMKINVATSDGFRSL
jgi:hypothetical protein